MKPRSGKRKIKPLNPATVVLLKQFARGAAIIAVISFLIFVVWQVTRLQSLTLLKVSVSGGPTVAAAVVEQAVVGVLEGTYLGLVPRRFIWFYPEAEVLAAVSVIDRIKDVSLRVEEQTLAITFSEYSPEALWCKKEAELENCLFLDETGYAFSPAPDLSGGSLLRYYTLQAEPTRGVTPFLPADYETMKQFTQTLADSGWYVSGVEVDSARDAFYTLAPSGEIKATLIDGAAAPLTFLQTIRQSTEFAHLTPGNFQYIDLRFGAKVFVNEEPLDAPVGTSTDALLDEALLSQVLDELATSTE